MLSVSRIKLLLDVVDDLRSLADSLSTLAKVMTGGAPEPEANTPDEPEPQTVRPSDSQPAVSLVDVRTRLGELSRAGYTAQVRAILERHGVARLSEVDPKDYEAILKEAEDLSNAPA